MSIPGNDSPFWPILLTAVLLAVYTTVASVGTKNGFDVEADLKAILGLIGSVVAVWFVKKALLGDSSDNKKCDK